jgi:uncharacterized membrane protein HdeD (DUF308 family)
MNKVELRLKGLMMISVILAVVDISVGCLLTFYLKFSTKLSAVIIGTVILLHGMFHLIRYIYDGLGKKVFAVNLITAVINVILGIFTMVYPFTSINHLGIIFAFYLLGNAYEKGFYGLKLRKKEDASYPLICVLSILLILMAVIVMFNPFSGFMLSTKLAGLFMICSGVFEAMICKLFFDKADVLLKMF